MGVRITDDFKLELDGIEREFSAIINHPFF
jgi:hypothetical protein